MLVFKPTNDRHQNVFLQPFTDEDTVKITPVEMEGRTPEKGDVKEEPRGKKEHFLYIRAKTHPDAETLP